MEELLIEEKAKRYDEAITRGSRLWESDMITRENYEYIFPEVKESGDIRKRIIDALHGDVLEMGEIKKAIAWLEKQGNLIKALQISNAKIGELIEKNYYLKEQLEKQGNNMGISEVTKQELEDNLNKALKKETPESCNEFLDEQGEQKTTIEMITPEESLGIDSDTYNKIVDECIYGEQKPIKEHNACEFCEERYGCVSPCSMKLIEEEKPADEIKPKFHEGDWVVYCNDDVDLITGIEENGYSINNGGYIPFICENEMRLWDITDAKVGDVLVSESTCGLGTWYCIFKSLDDDESMTVYCYLTRDGRFETKKELCFDKDPYNTKPATKEQRETLMKAMADAGYEWDAEKKELKKIEQSPAWSEEDIELLDNTIKFIEDRVAATSPSLRTYSPTLTGKEIPFLKALKDRVQPKQEWSEEDENAIQVLKDIVKHSNEIDENIYTIPLKDTLYDWLKSLKEKYTWKPSEGQLECLGYAIEKAEKDWSPLTNNRVYLTLKALKEQLLELRGSKV